MNKWRILLVFLFVAAWRQAAAQALIAGGAGNDALNTTSLAMDGAVYAAGTYDAALNLGGTLLPNYGGQDFFLLKTTPAGDPTGQFPEAAFWMKNRQA